MSDRSSGPKTSAERSPWSRPGVLLSGAFLLALVLLGIVAAVVGGTGSGASRPASAPRPAARPLARAATASRGGCTLPAGGQAVPSTSPPPAQWGTVGSMQVPQNAAVYGPQRSAGPWETCFAYRSS